MEVITDAEQFEITETWKNDDQGRPHKGLPNHKLTVTPMHVGPTIGGGLGVSIAITRKGRYYEALFTHEQAQEIIAHLTRACRPRKFIGKGE